jgi:hypothetical protein
VSRSRHARPAQIGDDLSRVTQAAISLADDIKRMGQAQARLQRAIAEARAGGRSQAEVDRAILLAGRGRDDRRRALEVVAAALREGAPSVG